MVAIILAVYAGIGFGLSVFACLACVLLGALTLAWALQRAARALWRNVWA